MTKKIALISGSGRLEDAVGKYTFQIARVLTSLGASCTVVLHGPRGPEFFDSALEVIQVDPKWRQLARQITHSMPKSLGDKVRARFRVWGASSLTRLSRRLSGFELVWDVFASSSPFHQLPLLLKRDSSADFLLDYHGITPPELMDSPWSHMLREAIGQLEEYAPRADFHITHSQFAACELVSRTKLTSTPEVISLFCDRSLVRDRAISRLFNDTVLCILYVGRLSKHKGLDTLLRALKEVRRRGTEARLVVAGAAIPYDNTEVECKRLSMTLDIPSYVEWTGRVDVPRLQRLYSTSDVLVLPSRHEAFGLPVVEAMWFDLPVIVSDSGSLPEIAGNAALVFKTNDHYDLAEKIVRLRENRQERDKILSEARKTRDAYTIDTFTKSISEFWTKHFAP